MPGCPLRGSWVTTALLAVAVARCGAPPEARPIAPGDPHSGGTLRLIQEAPAGLDPVHSESVYESLPINQIFDTLVATDASLNVVPSLADSWKISRDGLSYEFHLRKNVRFHDGHPFDAHDVVFTFRRVLADGGTESLAYPWLEPIRGAADLASGKSASLDGVVEVDDHTVRIVLTEANPLFLEQLAMDNLAIVPEHVLEANGRAAFERAPVGTGPFVFAAWDDERMILRRNPDYFRARANVDALVIHFFREGEHDNGLARFMRGEIDAVEPTTKTYPSLSEARSVELYRFQELSLSFLGLNSSRAPMDQAWLRRAIAHAIDSDRMVAASPAVRVRASGILPPGISGYTPESKRLAYSPDTARRILAEAGHAGGRGLPAIRLCDPSRGAEPTAVVRQAMEDLATIGLRVELEQITWGEMGQRLNDGNCPAFLLAWIADMSDPDAFLSGFGEHGNGDSFMFRDELAVDLLREAAREFDPAKRGRLYRKAERHILEQAPLVPLYHTRGMLATQPGVRGMHPGPFGVAKLELERVWFKPEEGTR